MATRGLLPTRRFVATLVIAMFWALAPPSPSHAAEPVASSANSAWLTDLYVETMGRSADEAGLDFWLARIASGGAASRERAAHSFVYGTEGSRIEVFRAYDELLGRAPDEGGKAFWTNYLRTHRVTILRANLIASDEYYATAGSDRAWLTTLYQEVLDRPIDGDGSAYWAGRLATGTPRWQVVLAIYLSPEALGNRADAYSVEILERTLTPTERAAAVALIRTEDERALRARLLASDEAFQPYLEAVGLLETAEIGRPVEAGS